MEINTNKKSKYIKTSSCMRERERVIWSVTEMEKKGDEVKKWTKPRKKKMRLFEGPLPPGISG